MLTYLVRTFLRTKKPKLKPRVIMNSTNHSTGTRVLPGMTLDPPGVANCVFRMQAGIELLIFDFLISDGIDGHEDRDGLELLQLATYLRQRQTANPHSQPPASVVGQHRRSYVMHSFSQRCHYTTQYSTSD